MADEPLYLRIKDLQPIAEELGRIPNLGPTELEALYISLLGRKQGRLTAVLKSIPNHTAAEKAFLGSHANVLKRDLEAAFEKRRAELKVETEARAREGVDLTMPGRGRWIGAEHPVTRVTEEIVQIFHGLGFARATGPEIETEWYNFGALNFPPDHPAMDMHDTLFLSIPERRIVPDRRMNRTSGVVDSHERRTSSDRRRPSEGRFLLRTHTSPVQIRTLMAHKPPVRVVIPGMCFRKDPFDASHAPVFAQIEGLVVDEGISFVDLKATLSHFAQAFFGSDTQVRFRPSFFPFTEPSAEMDVSCRICGGSGCSACKGTGWMEIMGAGMVHPVVLENCGIDPERYTGFAFGMGPARSAMIRYGVNDIRLFYEGDMRFLGQLANY
jgi:phenylalanyl-tRNA synthetase alpha chain